MITDNISVFAETSDWNVILMKSLLRHIILKTGILRQTLPPATHLLDHHKTQRHVEDQLEASAAQAFHPGHPAGQFHLPTALRARSGFERPDLLRH